MPSTSTASGMVYTRGTANTIPSIRSVLASITAVISRGMWRIGTGRDIDHEVEHRRCNVSEQLRAQFNYLKIAHPESAPAIQAAQDFIDAMSELQTQAGHSQDDIKELGDSIKALVKEQEA